MLSKLSEKQILWGTILLYIAVFGIITALRHYNFQTQTWDLAAFVQSFWNAANGRGLITSLEQVPNHLGLHFSPFLFLLVPGYVIFQSPYFLLFAQTVAIALGALPLYFLSKRVLNNQLLSHVIAMVYLLYPGLQWANMYDFHEITFFIPLMLAALYFIEEQKWPWAALFLALSASVKEDAIIAVIFVGIYLLIKFPISLPGRQAGNFQFSKLFGIATIVVALIYFILAVKLFMPSLGGGVLRFDRYANLGETPAAAIQNVVKNPALLATTIFAGPKISYFFWLFLPVLFLPFFSWRSLILLLPGLPENLLTNYHFQFSGLYHYDAILIPGIFVGAVYGLKNIATKYENITNIRKFMPWFFLGSAILSFIVRSPIGPFSFPVSYFKSNPTWEDYRQLVKIVPPEISVAANTNLVPHLSHRQFIYQVGVEQGMVDMVIIDGADLFPFKTREEMEAHIEKYLQTGLYKATVLDDRYIILLNNKFKLLQS